MSWRSFLRHGRHLARRHRPGTTPIASIEQLDRDDPLAALRDAFLIPDGVIYLDGNSLGPLPRATPARLAQVVAQEWGRGLIRSWTDAAWLTLPERIGDRIARLVGAPPGTVLAADGTSINLFKLLAAALALRPGRRTILTETGNFPSDLYIAEGLARLLDRGHTVRAVPRDALEGALDDDTAILMVTHVDYRFGALADMHTLTAAAHRTGALALWDLAHSAGALPVELEDAGADLAVGCGYKFLNGGPGAPAFLYVARHLQPDMRYPLTGWLGHADPFAFEPAHRAAPGIAAATVGTPSILAMTALEVGVELALTAPLSQVRAKSQQLAAILIEQSGLEPALPPGLPRGSQVSFRHPDARAVVEALAERGVIGDFRPPDLIRLGLTPLTLSHAEVARAAKILREEGRGSAPCLSRPPTAAKAAPRPSATDRSTGSPPPSAAP